KNSIEGYVTYLHNEETMELPDSVKWAEAYPTKFNIIKENLQGVDRDIALVMLSKEFWMYVQNDDFYKQSAIIDDYFKTNKTRESFYDLFSKNYKGFLAIAPGEPAPDFTLLDQNDNEVSLSQFEDKIVYIDFWGTWCGPCIDAIPDHLKLQEKLKDKNDVVFLNVALEYGEKDIKRWKNFLAEKNWPGVHVVAEKQFNNEELSPYKLTAAPSYVLVNKGGKLVGPRADGPYNILETIQPLLDKPIKSE
ncbi:MAG: TlpA disulfide reductase family protein, partial [Flavobacteriaceae bacterium]|nr:TlpA disulfide reductase family protein [Flavobacteriaceae bacterium]